MAQTKDKPKPPAPPKLPSKEEVAARLPLPGTQDDEEQGEGTTVDQIREHIDSINNLLDELESGQS